MGSSLSLLSGSLERRKRLEYATGTNLCQRQNDGAIHPMKMFSDSKAPPIAGAAGFTLVELMIVVAIVAILSAIAYPSYVSYITKSRRVAAEGCLSQYANYMERFYTSGLNYRTDGTGAANPFLTAGSTLNFDCASTQQTGSYYSYTLASATSSAYSVQAAPISVQATRDAKCGTLSLNQAGNRNASGTGGVSQCWAN
ncbi:type IV pilus assembly protein PilE [Rhodanobacter sp. K2T2]|uniref:type IV pilin protein n=1 Tax=Rhodanobacter sp. K2T2 TaxID=2723085 RepID=UPI0017F8097A|nr:type IV pilin protein [Rhodanobacter sp. K2T2]NYE30602.1 type IV pilus assembly protein PilE [Rhodanobacter sp. K2T2]